MRFLVLLVLSTTLITSCSENDNSFIPEDLHDFDNNSFLLNKIIDSGDNGSVTYTIKQHNDKSELQQFKKSREYKTNYKFVQEIFVSHDSVLFYKTKGYSSSERKYVKGKTNYILFETMMDFKTKNLTPKHQKKIYFTNLDSLQLLQRQLDTTSFEHMNLESYDYRIIYGEFQFIISEIKKKK